MRLLVATHYYDQSGGIERIAAELVRRLAARGVEVTWAATAPAPAGIRALPMRGVDPFAKRLGLPFPLWSPVDLGRAAARIGRFDLLHLHECLYLGNQVLFAAAHLAGVPVVVTQHVAPIPYRHWLPRAAMWLLARLSAPPVLGGADRCVFYSDSVRAAYEQMVDFERPPRMIANGVDRARFRPAVGGERDALREQWGLVDPTVLFVGRFVEKKGMHRVHEVARTFPSVPFLLVGTGPLDPRRWELPNVTVRPPMGHDALADLYRAADLLLLPSFGEGFPLVVQEAMACGTPVLVSAEVADAVPGFGEIAFTSPLESAPLAAALAGALGALSPGLRARTAAWAAERWDWDRCADQYLDLFREVAGEGPAAIASDVEHRAAGGRGAG